MTDFFLKKAFHGEQTFLVQFMGSLFSMRKGGDKLIIRSCQGEGSFTNTINLQLLLRYTLEEKIVGKPQRWRRHSLLRRSTLLSIMYIEKTFDIQRLHCLVWTINHVKSDGKSNQAMNLTTTTWERHPCCILICTGSDVLWFW